MTAIYAHTFTEPRKLRAGWTGETPFYHWCVECQEERAIVGLLSSSTEPDNPGAILVREASAGGWAMCLYCADHWTAAVEQLELDRPDDRLEHLETLRA